MSAFSTDGFHTRLPVLPLLSPEEEVELAKQIEAGVYAKHLLETGPWAGELEKISDAGDEAMERMVRANLGLVPFVAKTYLGQGLDMEELVNEGITGLILAVQKFDYKRGLKFSNVGVWWIRYALTVGTANTGRAIRVPRHIHADMIKLRKTESLLSNRQGAYSDNELAAMTGISEKRIGELRELAKPIRSLDVSLTEDPEFTLASVSGELHSPSPLEHVVASETTERLIEIFGSLSEVEMRYLDYRYGLSDGKTRSQPWIRRTLKLNINQTASIQARIDALMEHARSQEDLLYTG